MEKKMGKYYMDIVWRGRFKLTKNQYDRFAEISDNLHTLLSEIDQYTLLRLNIDDFIRYMDYFKKNGEHDFVSLNRYFTNFINSFYMWISFHEKNYKGIFSEYKSLFYDENFCYRAAYNIRTYTAHETMPITTIKTDVLSGEVSARIRTSVLINTSCKIQSRFRNELKQKQETLDYIDSLQLSQELKITLNKFQRAIWEKLQPQIASWLTEINAVFPVYDPAIVNAYVEFDNSDHPIPLGHQLKYLYDKSLRENYDFFKGYREGYSL